MKYHLSKSTCQYLSLSLMGLFMLLFNSPAAHGGLNFEMNMYRYGQGQGYAFYTPLTTNAVAPAAAVGTYVVMSPGWPTNGSQRGFEMTTTNVLIDRYEFDSEYGYGDFNSALQQITNGSWTILFTNSVSTNLYTFRVSAPNYTSNMLPATVITFPLDGSRITTSQTNFTWQGPANWPVSGFVYVTGPSYFEGNNFPASAINWTLPDPPPVDTGYSFNINFTTNFVSNIFNVSTPTNNVGGAPISGWTSTAVISSGSSVSFDVFQPGPPSSGHTNLAYYSFEDDSLFAQDFSGHGNNINSYGNYSMSPYITNDAAAGSYAFGSAGDGWLYPPTNLLATLAGSFTVSLWLRTADVHGNDFGDQYSAAGIVSAFNGSGNDVMPMGLTGGKLAFYTGGSLQNVLHSQASINTGQYVHLVVTRDQQTGEKRIYVNGVLDSSVYASTDPLTSSDGLTIGYNNGQPFTGDLDEIQFYSGVLSSDEVNYLFNNPGTNVADMVGASPSGGHNIVAHYDFDDGGSLGQDISGNGNDMSGPTVWGPTYQFDADAEAGDGAVQFFGTSCLYAGGQTLTNLNAVLAGSFTISAWVKTTVSNGTDGNNAFFGATIFWAYNDQGNTNDTIPLSITGSKAAFTTRDHLGNNNTLHSLTSVNDGDYHLITVTRDQVTGEKKIYVDGNFETSEIGTTDPLNGDNYRLTIGGWAYCTDGNCTNYYAYNGLLDDVQIYSGVLSGSEVAYLYANPGSNVLDTVGVDFNSALNTTGLPWATGGDTSWFVETTNSYDGVSAAQSGSVTGNQATTLSVTVNGPGYLDFYWSSFAEDPNGSFDYEFYIDNPNSGDVADLYGDNPWQSVQLSTGGPVYIPPGQHTLFWSVYSYGDTDPTQAGFLDSVSYVPDTMPVITLNPFSQTNYSGYPVWLSANATSNPAATWQWYKVGAGAIPGATTASFIPTNSGTAGVAGSYYAVAGNDAGSAFTTTAAVGFVSAPLPPDWSRAVKSPFNAEFSTNVIKDYYTGCAVDAAGNVYVADQYVGAVNVQSNFVVLNTLTAAGNFGAAAVAKHGADGRPIWAVGLTNNQLSSYSYGLCVALAPGNGAYLASVLIGTNWLGTNKFANTGGDSVLLSRFDANGSNIWSRLIGQSNQVFCFYNSLVSDAAGNLTVAGVLNGTADFGGTNLTTSDYMGFLAQYNANGGLLWAQDFPGFPQNLAYSAGRIYFAVAAVNSGGVTNLSLGSVSNLTDRAYGLAAINAANGQALWLRGVGEQYGAKTNGGFSDDIPLVSVSGADVFVTGTAYGSTALFGGLSVPLPGGRYQYFARYDTNGNAQVATNFGSATAMPWASSANSSGVYVSGDFDSFACFGNLLVAAPVYAQNYLGPNYFTQPFLAKFDRNGNALWARNGVSSLQANFRGIATAPDGVWASGINLINDIFHPAQFGTNTVFSDDYLYYFGTGDIALFTQSGLLTKVTESASATPVTLINPHAVGANFQFQFLSSAGFNHNILYRTNLAVGNWQTNSTVSGDGTVKTISLPFNLFTPAKQGFIRVSTQ